MALLPAASSDAIEQPASICANLDLIPSEMYVCAVLLPSAGDLETLAPSWDRGVNAGEIVIAEARGLIRRDSLGDQVNTSPRDRSYCCACKKSHKERSN